MQYIWRACGVCARALARVRVCGAVGGWDVAGAGSEGGILAARGGESAGAGS